MERVLDNSDGFLYAKYQRANLWKHKDAKLGV